MMNILFLSLMAMGWLVLGRIYIIKKYPSEEGFSIKDIIRWKTKRDLYFIIALIAIAAMSFWLETNYVSNSFIHNAKLVTLVSLLVTVAVPDYKENIIPNLLVLVGLIARIVFYIIELADKGSAFWGIIKNDLFGVGIVVIFFVLGVLVVKNGIGMGDIKLMLVMALFQGFSGIFSSLFFSLLIALVLSVGLMIAKKKTRKDTVPFAPSVLVGTFVSIILSGI